MKFAIITHVLHKKNGQRLVAYEPYVREMNLWLNNVDEVQIVAPFSNENVSSIDSTYRHSNIELKTIPSFDITSVGNAIKAIFLIPIISFKIFKTMLWADHIHLRCPGNIGLLGCFLQILFPSKPKTVKYAGNWDPKSKQPRSYRFQKRILSNTFLTRNTKVLVYGEWENQSKNIIPFFTATYTENEIVPVTKTNCHPELDEGGSQLGVDNEIAKSFAPRNDFRFIFVGGLTVGKQPLLSVQTVEKLKEKGYNVRLDMYGDGVERENIEKYIQKNNLEETIFSHGNVDKVIVKKAFQQSHFLVFISKSEGWPKVVAEAMFWSCLPITTAVSCVPYMIDNGNRGAIVTDDLDTIVNQIEVYLNDKELYQKQINGAKNWSQKFTLEKFEAEIKELLKS